MQYVGKSIATPAVHGENLGRLTELSPVQRPEGFRIAAKFSVVGGRAREQAVIVYVRPKEFIPFAKSLSPKGAIKKDAFLDGQTLIGRTAQLTTSADSTLIKRLGPVETPAKTNQAQTAELTAIR